MGRLRPAAASCRCVMQAKVPEGPLLTNPPWNLHQAVNQWLEMLRTSKTGRLMVVLALVCFRFRFCLVNGAVRVLRWGVYRI